MDYNIEEVDLFDKFNEFGLIKSDTIVFIPENIEEVSKKEDFIFSDSLVDVKKLFRINQININEFDGTPKQYRSRKNADWFGPAIFISLSMISQNPDIVSIALNVLSNYITDFFKGSFGNKTVKLDIYVETHKGKKVKKIIYNGNSEGLKNLPEIIKSL
jgi:hypothetical protein